MTNKTNINKQPKTKNNNKKEEKQNIWKADQTVTPR